jgi:Ribosome-associated protein Y (PSrp-1)
MKASIDLLVDKLDRQVKRYRERRGSSRGGTRTPTATARPERAHVTLFRRRKPLHVRLAESAGLGLGLGDPPPTPGLAAEPRAGTASSAAKRESTA